MKKDQKTVFETLREYCGSDAYPFHMPGHKRNHALLKEMYGGPVASPYEIDITEIDGMDNLHHAEGILKEAQKRAARIYGAEESFYLINGSTCGLLSAVFACTEQKGAILMARNCHKAVYHGAELRELKKYYLYPEMHYLSDESGKDALSDTEGMADGADGKVPELNGKISLSSVKEGLDLHPEVTAVLITSPTYDGMVSDVKSIAEIVHRYGKALIVDEAHGAHYGFSEYFPKNSLQLGADIVVHSLHKTLPSYTQTALLSLGKGSAFVNIEKVRKYLGMFETSSPSYVMMAGMDQCLTYVDQNKERLFRELWEELQDFYEFAEQLQQVHVVKKENQDLSKILIYSDRISGYDLAGILRTRYHLEVEMAAPGYVLALTTIFDTKEGFKRLKQALRDIDNDPPACRGDVPSVRRSVPLSDIATEKVLQRDTPYDKRNVPNAVGHVSGEYVYLYPPGIPLVVPGEVITKEVTDQMIRVKKLGFELQGMEDYTGETIRIIDIEE